MSGWVVVLVCVLGEGLAVADECAAGDCDATTPCVYADEYRRAIAAHRSSYVAVCRDPSAPGCEQARVALAKLSDALEVCLAGNVLPPPSDDLPPSGVVMTRRTSGIFGTFELLAGGALGLGDRPWRAAVGASPTVVARAGATWHFIGALLSFEWIPERIVSDALYVLPPYPPTPSIDRLRMLAHLAVEYRATPKLRVSARIGGGIDILSLSYRLVSYEDLEDTSVAFEIGCSAWFAVGHGIELGGTLDGLYADHVALQDDVRLPGSMYDSQLLIGARFNSR